MKLIIDQGGRGGGHWHGQGGGGGPGYEGWGHPPSSQGSRGGWAGGQVTKNVFQWKLTCLSLHKGGGRGGGPGSRSGGGQGVRPR